MGNEPDEEQQYVLFLNIKGHPLQLSFISNYL